MSSMLRADQGPTKKEALIVVVNTRSLGQFKRYLYGTRGLLDQTAKQYM